MIDTVMPMIKKITTVMKMPMIKKLTMMMKMPMIKKMIALTDKQMTRIKTGGDSLTRDSVPANSFSKSFTKFTTDSLPAKMMPCTLDLTWYDCEVSWSIVEAASWAGHKANIHPGVPTVHPPEKYWVLEQTFSKGKSP